MRQEIRDLASTTTITISETLAALVKELPPPEQLPGANTRAIPNLRDPHRTHVINGMPTRNPLTGEIATFGTTHPPKIDNKPITDIQDLEILGFSDEQLKILGNNSDVALEIFESQEKGQQDPNAVVGRFVTAEYTQYDVNQPGGLFHLLQKLSPPEAFLLLDSVGNVDGSQLNPLRFTMVGNHAGDFHPITVATKFDGQIRVPFVAPADTIDSLGDLNHLRGEAAKLVKEGILPIHPYNLPLLSGGTMKAQEFIPMHVLMSKRSMLPVDSDEQVKVSTAFQMTSRQRTINFDEARNAIENTMVLEQLAAQQRLPLNTWFIPDRYAARANGNDHTTSILRGGFEDLISINGRRLPEDILPVTACTLWSGNLLKPITLFQDIVEAGIDPDEFVDRAVILDIHTQFALMNVGYIPENHSQNLIYALDRTSGLPVGTIMRDSEGAKVDVAKIEGFGISYNGVYNPDHHATSPLYDTDPQIYREIMTRYLHYGIFDSNIIPLITHALPYTRKNAEEYVDFVRQVFIDWWQTNGKSFDEYEKIIAPGYHQHNLAVRGLRIKGHRGVRVTPEHPLIPSFDEMRYLLK